MPVKLFDSDRKTKRLKAVFPDGKEIHFGSKTGKTYIDHRDKKKREAYIARHKGSGKQDWSDPRTAGTLARYILWEE